MLKVLYKIGDDLRVDQAVSCLVRLMELTLAEELVPWLKEQSQSKDPTSRELAQLDLHTIEALFSGPGIGRYRVCPTGQSSGFIQLVSGETL